MKRKKVYKFLLILLRDLLILVLIGNILNVFTTPRDMWSVETVLRNCIFSIAIGYPAWKGMVWIVLALPSLKVAFIFMFLSLLVGNAILFFKNWKAAAIQQEELTRTHLALQYQSLKDQVRPHFLFNSLSSLATLINTDTEKATLFVHKLSDVYRYVLEQYENKLIPLKDDLKFMEDYIFLQKIRFGNNLEVKNNLKLDLNRMVIPLSLQMLVENAIKHNEIQL